MNFNDVFENVQVINLPERRDRRRQMQFQLKGAGMRAEFFPAERAVEAGDWPSAGARGCFQSHFKILDQALRAGDPNVLILEDDLDFAPDFKHFQEQALSLIAAADWDLLYLGHLEDEWTSRHFALELTDKPLMTAYFYAVHGRVLPRLVEFLQSVQNRQAGDPLGGPQHYDGALCMFRAQNPDVRTLIASPRLGFQRQSRSDISAAWYDQLPLVSGLINVGRRIRRVLRPTQRV